MPKAPVELDLYDSDDEKVKSLHRLIVPWGILKKAARLNKRIGKAKDDDLGEEDVDEITDLVIQIFGEDKVTRDELDRYADVGDMISVIKTIVARAQGLIPNAPPAAK
jgi:hypothetical protein